MTISGLSSNSPISFNPTTTRAQAQPADGDQVAMSLAPETFSSFVQEAGQMPDVRGELVDAFKSRIQSGAYPTQDTLDGVIDRMGSTWAKQAQLGTGSSSDS